MFEDLYSEPRPIEHQQVTGGRLRSRDVAQYAIPISTPKAIDATGSWSYFHPGRVDARFAPADFRAMVHAIDPQLEIVWHPVHERWCVWVKNPRITHWICPGWQMLFAVRYGDGSYMPLDARTCAEIANRSPRKWGTARQYWDRIVDEMTRDRRRKQTAHSDVVGQNARDRWDFAQIKVGYGPSNGSKFQQHHSGN